jgi:hypothetical protein
VDPEARKVWTGDLGTLPTSIFEQLQSTNMEFVQDGEMLYIIGGYAYAASLDDHVTFPKLTVVNVPYAIEAIIQGNSFTRAFRQIEDDRMQVTGGCLGKLDDEFYLIGGQKFMGLYNPMGPDMGPGFIQEYTNQIRRFRIEDDGQSLTISDYSAITDSAELHRRDYNMLPQIFPGGESGFTAFSGVFQPDLDLPWLNTVDITPTGHSVNNTFNQYLNQYHTASLPLYDQEKNEMHTVFFGGIGRYFLDETGNLVDDPNVPFVKTISQVTRYQDGHMEELKIGEMPDYLGTSAEFILNQSIPTNMDEIVLLDSLESDTVHLGYIVGGIRSSAPNIFWINTGTQSVAVNSIFRVKLVKEFSTNTIIPTVDAQGYFNLRVFPNPANDTINIAFSTHHKDRVRLEIFDINSRKIGDILNEELFTGDYEYRVKVAQILDSGLYFIKLSNQQFTTSVQFVVE